MNKNKPSLAALVLINVGWEFGYWLQTSRVDAYSPGIYKFSANRFRDILREHLTHLPVGVRREVGARIRRAIEIVRNH